MLLYIGYHTTPNKILPLWAWGLVGASGLRVSWLEARA